MNSNWSYSPETPNLGQIRRFLEPCDLEIWRMTLKNNRAPLLSNIKLYASFHHHMWIQTGVTVRKPLSWVVTSVTLTFDLWQAITLTSDIPTWRIKCPQSRKNCQIYPTKCRKNVMERKLLFPIIIYWFSAWIKPSKPRFIMDENGGCWQSWCGWSQTLPLNCSNQFTLMPLFFSHVNRSIAWH